MAIYVNILILHIFGGPFFKGAKKVGPRGPKNWDPQFSFFINPKGSPNQKSRFEHENRTKIQFYIQYKVVYDF